MLVLTRREGESIIIEGAIKIVVSRIGDKQVKLSIEAPKNIQIDRSEVVADRQRNGARKAIQ